MANSFTIILTEGDHDSAFLYRILKANGYVTYKRVLKDFPYPLSTFLASDLLKITIEEVKIEEIRRSRFLPSYVLVDGDNLVLIYAVGGESRADIRKALVRSLNALNTQDPDAIQVANGVNISVLYFFDADNMGVGKRLDDLNYELQEVFEQANKTNLTNSKIQKIDNLFIGAFIFTEKNTDTGRLEDLLIPLMQKDNDDIFRQAHNYLSIHEQTNLFKGKLKIIDGVIKKVNEQKYDVKKAIIGTIGQLQKPGKSNTVCISDADYLNNEKIHGNQTCQEIYELIKSATNIKES